MEMGACSLRRAWRLMQVSELLSECECLMETRSLAWVQLGGQLVSRALLIPKYCHAVSTWR